MASLATTAADSGPQPGCSRSRGSRSNRCLSGSSRSMTLAKAENSYAILEAEAAHWLQHKREHKVRLAEARTLGSQEVRGARSADSSSTASFRVSTQLSRRDLAEANRQHRLRLAEAGSHGRDVKRLSSEVEAVRRREAECLSARKHARQTTLRAQQRQLAALVSARQHGKDSKQLSPATQASRERLAELSFMKAQLLSQKLGQSGSSWRAQSWPASSLGSSTASTAFSQRANYSPRMGCRPDAVSDKDLLEGIAQAFLLESYKRSAGYVPGLTL
eukprot:TRINITY_DN105464_c0_g1_i1.p1 TRINITY_DN105464_c0_g1~~TRINITY_DN105464_c0_g1_i1.p1  ORF type:complete len:285 (-),score=56.76 TRINITY_DN105464_c0_g1_i1:18-842(-)